MIKPRFILFSPIMPINKGAIAPPTMVSINIDDAVFVLSPRPLSPRAKIEGNIIDMNR